MAYNKKHKRRVAHRTNRLWSETHNTWAVPTKIAGVVAFLVVVGIAYAALVHSVDALTGEIGSAERERDRLTEDLRRTTTDWERLLSFDNLERTLRNNGISMRKPAPGRRIAMGGYALPAGAAPAAAFRGPTAVAANL